MTPAIPVRTNAPNNIQRNKVHERCPSAGISFSGKSQFVHIRAMPTYIPIMKNSDCAKFPYLCTLYVRVSPTAIERYVEDHVSVFVPRDATSISTDAEVSRPRSRMCRVRRM